MPVRIPGFHGKAGDSSFGGIIALLFLACSCGPAIRPSTVPGPTGPVILNSAGVFAREGASFHAIDAGGVAALHKAGGEVWGTCISGCGARRLLPPGRRLARAEGLLDDRVASVAGSPSGTLYFSYDPALDFGISALSGSAWTHYSSSNSALASGKVGGIIADGSGGVWVRYVSGRLGVAHISNGLAVNFTTANSALPYDTIEMVVPEPAGRGAWFVTTDGLTHLDLARMEWKHYGRRHGDATDFLRMSGLDPLFGGGITGINGVAFTDGGAWFSTRLQVFRFDGGTFRPVPAGFIGGLGRLRFSSIFSGGQGLWAVVENMDSRKQVAVASWYPEKGWEYFSLEDYHLPFPDCLIASYSGSTILFTAGAWGARGLEFGADRRVSVWSVAGPPNYGK